MKRKYGQISGYQFTGATRYAPRRRVGVAPWRIRPIVKRSSTGYTNAAKAVQMITKTIEKKHSHAAVATYTVTSTGDNTWAVSALLNGVAQGSDQNQRQIQHIQQTRYNYKIKTKG